MLHLFSSSAKQLLWGIFRYHIFINKTSKRRGVSMLWNGGRDTIDAGGSCSMSKLHLFSDHLFSSYTEDS